jgi:hypothetical protein
MRNPSSLSSKASHRITTLLTAAILLLIPLAALAFPMLQSAQYIYTTDQLWLVFDTDLNDALMNTSGFVELSVDEGTVEYQSITTPFSEISSVTDDNTVVLQLASPDAAYIEGWSTVATNLEVSLGANVFFDQSSTGNATISYVENIFVAYLDAPPNTPPTITINPIYLDYTEGDGVIQIDPAADVHDLDGDQDWNGGSLIAQIAVNAETFDKLTIPDNIVGTINTDGTNLRNTTTIIGTLSAAEGTVTFNTPLTITFNANATNSLVAQTLQAIHYSNTSDDPSVFSRSIAFSAYDNSFDSDDKDLVLYFTKVNDPPTLTVTSLNPTFTEGGAAATLFSDAAASTVEFGQRFTELGVTLTNATDGADEKLIIGAETITLTAGNSGSIGPMDYLVYMDNSTATLALEYGSVTEEDIQTIINSIAYANTSITPNTANRVATIVHLKDDGNDPETHSYPAQTSTVTVVDIDNEPTLSATAANPVFFENGTAVDLFNSPSVSVIEDGQVITQLVVEVTEVSMPLDEVLIVDGEEVGLSDLTISSITANGYGYGVGRVGNTVTVTISAANTPTEIETLIDNLAYRNYSDNPGTASRVVTIKSLTDSGTGDNVNDTLAVASTVTMTVYNDAPTLTGGFTMTSTDEETNTPGITVASILAGITANDPDGDTMGIAIVTANGSSAWQFSTDSSNGLDGNWTDLDAMLAPALTNALLLDPTTWVRYVPNTISAESVAFGFKAWDQTTGAASTSGSPSHTSANPSGDSTAFSSATTTVSLFVSAVNDAPTIANLGGDTASFSIGGAAVNLDTGNNADISDVDSTDFNGGNIAASIVANGQPADDLLLVGDIGNISTSGSNINHTDGVTIGTWAGGSTGADLVITLNANATLIRTRELLRALQYGNLDSMSANTLARTVSITVNDGDGDTSASQDVTVTLLRSPIIDLDSDDSSTAVGTGYAAAFTEGDPALALGDTDSQITDDGTFKSLTVTLSNRPDTTSHILYSTFGTGAQTVNTEAVTIGSYNPSNGVLSITVDDASTDAATMKMLIDSIRYANTSETLNDTTRLIFFEASDNDNNLGPKATATITMTAVNNPPAILTNTGRTVDEGATVTINNTYLNEDDPDDSGLELTYRVTTVAVNGQTWVDLNLNAVIDGPETAHTADGTFTQHQVDNNYVKYIHDGSETTSDSFIFALEDGGEDGAAPVTNQTFAITVTAVNDAPVLAGLEGDSLNYYMSEGVAVLDQGVAATISDIDSANFDNGSLLAIISTGLDAAEDVITFENSSGVTFSAGVATGSVISVSGMPVGTIVNDGIGGSSLLVSFDQASGNATAASIATLVKALAYINTDNTAATTGGSVIRVTVNDGDGGSSLENNVFIQVLHNTAPTISGAPGGHVYVGSTYYFTPTIHDANGHPLTYSIVNKPAWATFNTANGQLSGTPDISYVGNYTGIVITVSDPFVSTDLAAFDILVTDPSGYTDELSNPISDGDTLALNQDGAVTIGVSGGSGTITHNITDYPATADLASPTTPQASRSASTSPSRWK